jgi:hypothetical protein
MMKRAEYSKQSPPGNLGLPQRRKNRNAGISPTIPSGFSGNSRLQAAR